ncbi:MAG: heavy metal-binding domain-containing protein [Paludibacter sp.]|nr:heavy metal-binding domain-containing protein [Paludibacter sp.]
MKKRILISAMAILAIFTITATANNLLQEQTVKAEYTCPMHPEVITDKPGQCPKCGMDLEKKEVAKVEYTCPMHPEVISEKPGKCPKCDMTLVKKEIAKVEYTCPMHPEVISDKSGKCPKCGMELIKKEKGAKKKNMMKGCGTMNM